MSLECRTENQTDIWFNQMESDYHNMIWNAAKFFPVMIVHTYLLIVQLIRYRLLSQGKDQYAFVLLQLLNWFSPDDQFQFWYYFQVTTEPRLISHLKIISNTEMHHFQVTTEPKLSSHLKMISNTEIHRHLWTNIADCNKNEVHWQQHTTN